MEDCEGVAIPSQSGITDDENSQIDSNEGIELSKQVPVREHLFQSTDKSCTDSNSFKGFDGFSNINGDCVEKNVDDTEQVLASSSNNSLSSAYSETTKDSNNEESNIHKEHSGSENESKSSCSEASLDKKHLNLPKLDDSHHMSSELSDTSSDSSSSDSDDSFVDREDIKTEMKPDVASMIGSLDNINTCVDAEKEVTPETDISSEQDNVQSCSEAERNSDLKCDSERNEVTNTDISQNSSSVNVTDIAENVTDAISNNQDEQCVLEKETKSPLSCIDESGSCLRNDTEPLVQDIAEPESIDGHTELLAEEPMETECGAGSNIDKDNFQCFEEAKTEQGTSSSGLNQEKNTQDDNLPEGSSSKKVEERVCISQLSIHFSIQYKGFKKTRKISGVLSDKSILKTNPFNPAWKRRTKNRFGTFRDEIDCSTLQPEYAQYLGLQPIVKFKCSNCGMSTFQTMSALNTHQVECKKNGKFISHSNQFSTPPDVNSANIKLTRKVFLCSSCGTYYENCDLFLHMREFHRRYICLFCLFMAQSPEILQDHLKDKHDVSYEDYSSPEELQKRTPETFFLLCFRCDRVFTEMDDSVNHKCTSKSTSEPEHIVFKKPRTDITSIVDSPFEPSNLTAYDTSKFTKTPLKINKEVNANSLNSFGQVSNEITKVGDDVDSENVIFPEKSLDEEVFKYTTEKDDVSIDADNLQLKVPSGIEIKPLIPGENININEIETKQSIEIIPISPVKKRVKFIKRTKKIIKRTIVKRKPSKGLKMKIECIEKMDNVHNSISPPKINDSEIQPSVNTPPIPDSIENDNAPSPIITQPQEVSQTSEPDVCKDMTDITRPQAQEVFKLKLPGEMDSDGESDDSQKLSLVVDENTNNSDAELLRNENAAENGNASPKEESVHLEKKIESNDIPLAREDVAAMALTLDDKIENVSIQAVVKECVRTSCMSCNYCRHACKIVVNGKQLVLHLLSEHRYTPVKNETHEDVVRKLMNSLNELQNMYFNTETYDSSDPSIHIPYDQEKNYDCFQCSYVSLSHKDLYAHKKKCHTKSLLLCIMCKSNFYSYSELICHICPGTYNTKVQFHNVDLIFRCCFCRLDTIPSAFRLMVHLRKSHHTCDICLEMCTDQQKLSTHMWKHKLNHLCYRCGIAYASKPDITKHLFWKHGTESVLCKKCLQKKWPHVYHFCIPPTSFNCEECHTSFSKAVALKVHKRIHGNDYPYSCEQCDKKFVSKKLLARHIERHNAISQRKEKISNSPHEDKEEIINVTDVNDGKDSSLNENSDANKESDGKDKIHKKHKKEKEKKEKKVVDVYDLPPLNLSSESDSSDEEGSSKEIKNNLKASLNVKLSPSVEDKQINITDMPKLDGPLDDELNNSLSNFNNELNSRISEETSNNQSQDKHVDDPIGNVSLKPSPELVSRFENTSAIQVLLPLAKDPSQTDDLNSPQDEQVEGIWENFYKTNPQNSKLPFPLCAMKSEVAYSIIMGDHDYCQVTNTNPVIKEDLPSTSNLIASLSDDKLEEVSLMKPENSTQTPPPKELETSTPTSMLKKKLKSPKKKVSKTPEDNNSSSSSDSSSDSDSSSCSCGTNCSCTSTSSNSSSSSSSDSDSSANEDKSKQDKRKKRKDKRSKQKSENEDVVKETSAKEHETSLPIVPEDPPIRESELETDETTSDEEFYDRQPQIIANQMLAEKRQMVLLATGAPVNNGNASPTVVPLPPPTLIEPDTVLPPAELLETPKQKTKLKRKRKIPQTSKVAKFEKTGGDPYPKSLKEQKPYSPFQHAITTPKQKPQLSVPQSPSLPEAGGSGPESDSTRLSKRRRVPNKFYGYSSGEEEDAPKQTPKWKKMESLMTPIQTPKIQSSLGPPTPRIQLTVPKQIIRKPTYHKASMKSKQQQSTSESSDSGSDVDDRIPRPSAEEPIKAEKDVYCYCRCPYDEVSEMIACDDVNCKIEWFHFECVGILVPPRGQWFCPGCRKARGLPT